ncbi:MAG: hypothetical protein VKI42_00510 [Synechococcaceae cyanobacterium]|nr:hypothetical protein [Synechococcaceae cyanobacterium]
MTDPRLIFETPPGTSPRWRVEQYHEDHPQLIRFVRWNRTGKSLDQVARWAVAGWDSSRWVPKPPTVPAPVLRAVMAELVRREVVG